MRKYFFFFFMILFSLSSCSRHDKVATDDSEIPEYEDNVNPVESMQDTTETGTDTAIENY